MLRFKWLFLFVLLLAACGGSKNYQPEFTHTLIKQPNVSSPSFVLLIENDMDGHNYTDQIEDAFIKRKIPVYSAVAQVTTSRIDGTSKGVASNMGGGFAVSRGRIKGTNTIKSDNVEDTQAAFIYIVNCYGWAFKVVLAETRELIMKGVITNDFDTEIEQMMKTLMNSGATK